MLHHFSFSCFLPRFHDISPEIRTECVQKAKYLMLSKPDLLHDVAGKYSVDDFLKMVDPGTI